MNPHEVVSPRDRWQLGSVLYTHPTEHWSIATGWWGGDQVVAIRWDGDDADALGYPNSAGHPVWFILPEVVGVIVRALAEILEIEQPQLEEPQDQA